MIIMTLKGTSRGLEALQSNMNASYNKSMLSWEFRSQRVIMLFNRTLPTRCQKTSLRAFISWIAGMAPSMR